MITPSKRGAGLAAALACCVVAVGTAGTAVGRSAPAHTAQDCEFFDSDGDGVNEIPCVAGSPADDECPDPGPANNRGCPLEHTAKVFPDETRFRGLASNYFPDLLDPKVGVAIGGLRLVSRGQYVTAKLVGSATVTEAKRKSLGLSSTTIAAGKATITADAQQVNGSPGSGLFYMKVPKAVRTKLKKVKRLPVTVQVRVSSDATVTATVEHQITFRDSRKHGEYKAEVYFQDLQPAP